MPTWRHGRVEVRRRGGVYAYDVDMEACMRTCRRVGVEVWRLDAAVATWRHGYMEVWKLDDGVAMWRYGCMQFWSAGGALQV